MRNYYIEVFKNYKAVIVFEEGVKKGGVGSAVLEFAANIRINPRSLEGVDDVFVPMEKVDLLQEIGWMSGEFEKNLVVIK